MTAKLFIDGDERELHYVDMDYNRITSFIGWPVSEIFGGLIHLRFTPRGDEDFFLNWMFAQRDLEYPRCLYTFKNGEVVFYEGDVTEDILFKYRFADCILISYKETFSNQWGMETEMVLSPAIQYYNHKSKYPFLKRWNESYVPPREKTPYQPIENNNNKKFTDYYLTDTNNEKISNYKIGDTILLCLETQNRIGDKVTINLNDPKYDFEHNGISLENDTLKNHIIGKDLEKIKLEVIKQKNN